MRAGSGFGKIIGGYEFQINYDESKKSSFRSYFNDHYFQKYNGVYSNYVDIENVDEYWISGLKKKESNRHSICLK